MTIIPNQPFGLGDIIFCQTLVRRIADGRPILWPVFPQIVEGLNRAYPDITFVDWKTLPIDYERNNQYEQDVANVGLCTVLPIRFADSLMKVPYSQCMASKYMMYGMHWRDWQEQAMWARCAHEKIKFCVPIKEHLPFALVNKTFGSDCAFSIKIDNPSQYIEVPMSVHAGISLFDWDYMMQEATEIHTVSTSIIYLLEMLELKAKEVHLYPRKPIEHDFRNVDYLLRRHKYILHA